MIYVVEGTDACPCGFTPEVYDDLKKAVSNLLHYTDTVGEPAFTIARYSSLEEWKTKFGLDIEDDDDYYDFTNEGGE